MVECGVGWQDCFLVLLTFVFKIFTNPLRNDSNMLIYIILYRCQRLNPRCPTQLLFLLRSYFQILTLYCFKSCIFTSNYVAVAVFYSIGPSRQFFPFPKASRHCFSNPFYPQLLNIHVIYTIWDSNLWQTSFKWPNLIFSVQRPRIKFSKFRRRMQAYTSSLQCVWIWFAFPFLWPIRKKIRSPQRFLGASSGGSARAEMFL